MAEKNSFFNLLTKHYIHTKINIYLYMKTTLYIAPLESAIKIFNRHGEISQFINYLQKNSLTVVFIELLLILKRIYICKNKKLQLIPEIL